MQEVIFQSPSGDILNLETLLDHIKLFLAQDKNSSYKLTIGTDSEVKSTKGKKEELKLITAVVIYRKGWGGRYFWTKKQTKTVATLREKIYQEVLLSLDLARVLVPELKTRLNGLSSLYDLEIHIDVGENGATREMIREVVGMVTGNGFVAKTKPYSYAASNIADRHA